MSCLARRPVANARKQRPSDPKAKRPKINGRKARCVLRSTPRSPEPPAVPRGACFKKAAKPGVQSAMQRGEAPIARGKASCSVCYRFEQPRTTEHGMRSGARSLQIFMHRSVHSNLTHTLARSSESSPYRSLLSLEGWLSCLQSGSNSI